MSSTILSDRLPNFIQHVRADHLLLELIILRMPSLKDEKLFEEIQDAEEEVLTVLEQALQRSNRLPNTVDLSERDRVEVKCAVVKYLEIPWDLSKLGEEEGKFWEVFSTEKGEEDWRIVEKVFQLNNQLRYAEFHDTVWNPFDEDGAEEVYYDGSRTLRAEKPLGPRKSNFSTCSATTNPLG
jgi:hypothetical protein